MDLLYSRKVEWLEKPKSRSHTYLAILYRILITGGFLLALTSMVLTFGFELPKTQQQYIETLKNFSAILFALILLFELLMSRGLGSGIRDHLIEIIIILFIGLQLLLIETDWLPKHWPAADPVVLITVYFISVQIFLFIAILLRAIRAGRYLFLLNLSPPATFSLTFMFLILGGAFLLWLPRSTYGSTAPNIAFIDALFTAASAVCVTGLITVDTATVYSRMGQSIILLLIQLGGLGIMTLVGFFTLNLNKGNSIRSRLILQDVLGTDALSTTAALVRVIILSTFISELIGVAILLPGFWKISPSLSEALFLSLFHSVSAFCNAGFATFTTNLESFSNTAGILLPVGLLVIIGGIGFPVIYETTIAARELLTQRRVVAPISVHTKLAFRWTLILLLFGILIVLLGVDWSEYTSKEILLNSVFQAIMPRTAGFNSIPLAQLAPWCLILFMGLMYVGGAPGGTAGGVKVTTLGMLFHGTITLIRGRKHIEVMKRTIPERILHSAFVITGVSAIYITFAIAALVWAEPDLPFFHLVFEIFSAFGTVGLSLGVTDKLSTLGKLIIILTMYFGRVGPIMLFLAIFRKRKDALYEYPTGSVIVG